MDIFVPRLVFWQLLRICICRILLSTSFLTVTIFCVIFMLADETLLQLFHKIVRYGPFLLPTLALQDENTGVEGSNAKSAITQYMLCSFRVPVVSLL